MECGPGGEGEVQMPPVEANLIFGQKSSMFTGVGFKRFRTGVVANLLTQRDRRVSIYSVAVDSPMPAQAHASGAPVAELLTSFCAWANAEPRARSIAQHWSARIQFTPRDGDWDACYLVVGSTGFSSNMGVTTDATVVFTSDQIGWTDVLNGDLDVTHLLARGRATVTGRYYDAMNLSRLALL